MKSPEQTAFKVILIVAVLIAIVSWPFVSHADSHRSGPPNFEKFDTDGDGFISEEEFNTLRSERIAARAAEGRQMKGMANAPAFSSIDSNGDGKLDRDEFTAGRDAHMKAMREKHGGQGHGQGHGQDHGKGMGKGTHSHGHGTGQGMPTFGDLDLNGDGCIDAEEFAKHQAERHGKRDAEETQQQP